MTLSFGLSPWLLALSVALALGLTYWTYRRTTPPLAPGRRLLLAGLRAAALTVILVLLFEPIFRRLERTTEPPVLAVLIDDSQSLTLGEDSARVPTARAIRDALASLGALDGEVRYFRFSGEAAPLDDGAAEGLTFEGGRTDIAGGLDRVRDAFEDQNLRGVLLVSDGRYNTGRNPLYVAERYPVPIHTLVVGDTTSRRDLLVRRVSTNELAYVGAEQPVEVGLRTEGLGGERVTVSLMRGGRVLASTGVTLPDGTAEVPIDLAYLPETEGFHRYEVVVTELDGEATTGNNRQSFTVRVLADERRLLLVAAAPDPDLAALREILDATDTEIDVFTQKQRGAFYEGAFPADLSGYDAIVLVGYPGAEADHNVVGRVKDAVADGVPLLFMMSRSTAVGRVANELAEVLPVVPRAARSSYVEAAFLPTPAGLAHPVLEGADDAPLAWRRLPPLLYNESRWEARPDARVLARLEVRGVPLDDPMLVVQRRVGRRTAALLGAGTWRWRNLPEDLDDLTPVWPTLLDHLLRWITAADDDRPVRVEPVADVFDGGEPVLFTGQVYDESLNPVDGAAIAIEVTAPDGTVFPYTMTGAGNGQYRLDVGTLPEGTYQFTARARRNEGLLGQDGGSFAVGAVTLELQDGRADPALLRQMARRSGGTFFESRTAPTVPTALAASGAFTPITTERTRETPLRDVAWMLAVVVALLTLEWFFRKRSGLV